MFKGKLIEDKGFYRLKGRQFILMVSTGGLAGIFIHLDTIPWWSSATVVAMYIGSMVYLYRDQKQISKIFGKKIIRINEKGIRIQTEKKQIEEILIEEVDKVLVKETYRFHEDDLKKIWKIMDGKPKEDYLLVQVGEMERRFDFEIESEFMANRLSQVILQWKTAGHSIEIIPEA